MSRLPSSPKRSQVKTRDMLIGALLRVPAHAIHRRIIKELNAAGFDELRMPHSAVLQFHTMIDQRTMNTTMALNFMRSANAPVISAGVMMANINWKTMKVWAGIVAA